LYEGVYLYGMWINYTIETNIDRRDGEAWQEFTRNKSFQSKSCCQQTTEKNKQ